MSSNFTTTTNTAGEAVFSAGPTEEVHHYYAPDPAPGTAYYNLLYSTTSSKPVIDGTESDLKQYGKDRVAGIPPGGITHPAGCTAAFIVMPKGATSPMHRTMTLDIDYVLEGEVELELDSGEKKILRKGDSVVMRATNHKWTNIGDGDYKMVCFAQSLEEASVKIGDRELGPVGLS